MNQPWGVPLTLVGHKDRITSLAFSQAGQTIVSGDSNGTLRFWAIEAIPTQTRDTQLLLLACNRLKDHPSLNIPGNSHIRKICQKYF